MALVVEDGNGLPNANAYITVEFADDYFSTRGITTWTGTEAVKEVAIIKATDYIDTVFGDRFLGDKANVSWPADYTVDQALEWPRVLECSQELPIALPPQLQKACAEYAHRALINGTLLADPTALDDSGQQVSSISEKVGPIETSTTYVGGAIEVTQPYPSADLLLKKLVRTGGMAIRG